MEQINQQLQKLICSLRNALAGNLIGIYLHGSLALGGFNPARSDLDLLGVTRAELTPRSRSSVTETLLALSGQPAPVEISVLRYADLNPWRHPCPYIYHYSEAWRTPLELKISRCSETQHQETLAESTPVTDPDLAAHLTVLRARGKALYGPPVAEVFPEIPRADFLDSVLQDVLSEEFGLSSEKISPVDAVLNACRTLTYLQRGAILSKLEGGQWARGQVPARFVPVLEAALAAYQTTGEIPRDAAFNSFKSWLLQALQANL